MSEETLLFQAKAVGLPKPEREYRFHPVRRWRSDFAWPAYWLLVEVEGGVFSGGRHVRGKGYERDCEKYNTAQAMGYRVLRFTTGMVRSGDAIKVIESVMRGDPDAAS